jgi:hypothetical protein
MQPAAGKINYDDFNKTNFGLSVIGTKRTLLRCGTMSAFGGKADITRRAGMSLIDLFRKSILRICCAPVGTLSSGTNLNLTLNR